MNAVMNALRTVGVTHFDMPAAVASSGAQLPRPKRMRAISSSDEAQAPSIGVAGVGCRVIPFRIFGIGKSEIKLLQP